MLGVNGANSKVVLNNILSTNDGPLVVASSGNINMATGVGATVATSGGDIVMLAGVNFTSPSLGVFDITGGSVTGGRISLPDLMPFGVGNYFSSAAYSGNTNGGNVTLAAFAGTGFNSGTFPNYGTSIYSGGSGTGTNGNVIEIAGATNQGSGVSLIAAYTINTTGGTGGGGNVTIATATPGFSGGGLVINNGAITSGAVQAVGTPTGSVSILIGSINTSGGNVSVISSADIDWNGDGGSITSGGGAITLVAGAAFGVPTSGVINITGASLTGGQTSRILWTNQWF